MGFPDGVVNVVTGLGDAGAALAAHPDVDKVAFTGSTEVGHEIVKASAGNLKRVSLELGGKSPVIVFDDADVEAAAAGARTRSSSTTASAAAPARACSRGRRCATRSSSASRTSPSASKVGDGFDPATEMGPLVSREQYDRVCSYIRSGEKSRAGAWSSAARRGRRASTRATSCSPTIFEGVKNEMRIVREEIFGPVLARAVASTTSTRWWRAATTRRTGSPPASGPRTSSKAHRVAAGLRAGTVWINCHNVFDAAAPFGGFKQSGYGREMGHHALELYTQTKNVIVNLG